MFSNQLSFDFVLSASLYLSNFMDIPFLLRVTTNKTQEKGGASKTTKITL